jgi:hypothetical protein
LNDDALVDTASANGILPLAEQLLIGWDEKISVHSNSMTLKEHMPLPNGGYPIRRIMYVRVDTIGDAVLAFPILPYIKQHYPDAILTVLCQQHIAELYEACPQVNTVIPIDFWKAYNHESYREVLLSKIHAFIW